jgi:hypothetical protein
MDGRLRINVVKSDCVIVFPNDFRRNLSRDDFLENSHDILPAPPRLCRGKGEQNFGTSEL